MIDSKIFIKRVGEGDKETILESRDDKKDKKKRI